LVLSDKEGAANEFYYTYRHATARLSGYSRY
jgi:hypothetical protein